MDTLQVAFDKNRILQAPLICTKVVVFALVTSERVRKGKMHYRESGVETDL